MFDFLNPTNPDPAGVFSLHIRPTRPASTSGHHRPRRARQARTAHLITNMTCLIIHTCMNPDIKAKFLAYLNLVKCSVTAATLVMADVLSGCHDQIDELTTDAPAVEPSVSVRLRVNGIAMENDAIVLTADEVDEPAAPVELAAPVEPVQQVEEPALVGWVETARRQQKNAAKLKDSNK